MAPGSLCYLSPQRDRAHRRSWRSLRRPKGKRGRILPAGVSPARSRRGASPRSATRVSSECALFVGAAALGSSDFSCRHRLGARSDGVRRAAAPRPAQPTTRRKMCERWRGQGRSQTRRFRTRLQQQRQRQQRPPIRRLIQQLSGSGRSLARNRRRAGSSIRVVARSGGVKVWCKQSSVISGCIR